MNYVVLFTELWSTFFGEIINFRNASITFSNRENSRVFINKKTFRATSYPGLLSLCQHIRKRRDPGIEVAFRVHITLFVLIFARTNFRAFAQKFPLVSARNLEYRYYAQRVLGEIKYARNLT